jgi:[ribosomal protein S5]-alanine N-acetyltransferase
MKIRIETPRLILREVWDSDENDMFEMDSDPEVHKYIQNNPIKSIEQIRNIISRFKKQYEDNNIGILTVTDKITGECLGWTGIKFVNQSVNNHINFYELGYRFKRKHWGKGYAMEAAKAVVDYVFTELNAETIFAQTDVKNISSKKVLENLGFIHLEVFDDEGDLTDWFELKNIFKP